MIRLLVSLFVALGLTLSPAGASTVQPAAEVMADCDMQGGMPDMPAHESKMACCTPACQAPSSPALLPNEKAAPAAGVTGSSQRIWTPVKELTGIKSSGLDPPPRA